MNGKKLTLFGVIAATSAASAVYGLYRAGLIKNEHFTKLYNAIKQSIDDNLNITSEGHVTPKARTSIKRKMTKLRILKPRT